MLGQQAQLSDDGSGRLGPLSPARPPFAHAVRLAVVQPPGPSRRSARQRGAGRTGGTPAPPAARPAATSCASPSAWRASAWWRPASTRAAAPPRGPPAALWWSSWRERRSSTAARVTAADVEAELGGLLPADRHAAELAADALHRALGAAARDGAPRLRASPRRTLVAMSGGVDSAAAAQLAIDAGDDVVAVTLELWADPATDEERSCCSPRAVLGARELAHGMGIPHVTLDLRERFRADGGGRVPGRVRRRPHAQPLRALQRRGALRRDARPGGRARRGAARHRATTRGSPATSRARSCAPAPTRARTRATCWPGSSPRSSSGSRSRSAG